jgi:hypothetical protein
VIVRRVLIAAVLTVALVGVAAPGASAATVSPSEWAPKFCSTLTTYQEKLSTGSDDLTTSLSGTTNLKKARATLVAFLGKMSGAAKTAQRDLQKAGSPSSANGSKIAAKFVAALGQSSDIFAKAKAQAAKVSTSNPTAFQKQGVKVGTDLSAAATKLADTFAGISTLDTDGELATAMQADSSCSSLFGST